MISKYLVKDFIFIFSVYVSDCVCMYVCAPDVCLVPAEARTGPSDPWELELQAIVSYPQDLCKSYL